MYILEKLWDWLFPQRLDKEFDYDPLNQSYDDDDQQDCRHEFRPVDSSGEILACIKCGFVVKIKNNNNDN